MDIFPVCVCVEYLYDMRLEGGRRNVRGRQILFVAERLLLPDMKEHNNADNNVT